MPFLKKFSKRGVIPLILIATFLTAIWGYRIDLTQALWTDALPYAAWFKDQTLFSGDLYARCFPYMFTLLYPAFGKVSQLTSPIYAALIFLFIENLLAVFSVYYLAITLFKSKITAYLSLFWLLLAGGLRYGLGGLTSFGVTINPSLLAFPLLLIALNFLLKRKYFWSIIVTAFTYNIHVSLSFLTSIIFFIFFLRERSVISKKTLKSFFWGSFLGIMMVLPTFFNIIFAHYPKEEMLPSESWFTLMKLRNTFHIFPTRFGISQWIPFITLVGVWFFLMRRRIFSLKQQEVSSILLGVFLVCVIGTVFVEIFPMKFFIMLYPFRSTFFFIVFIFIYLSHYLEKIIFKRRPEQLVDKINKFFLPVVLTVLVVVRLNMVPALRILDFNEFPRFRIYTPGERQRDSDWLATQKWVATNTPKNKLILVPPALRGFRAFSERGIVIAWEDVNYPIYYPHTGQEILRRLEDFGIDPFAYHDSNEAENSLKEAYLKFKEADFVRIAQKYNVSDAVVEKDTNLSFSEVYTNESFKIYRIF